MILDNYPRMLMIIVIIMHEYCYSYLVYWFPRQILAALATLVYYVITKRARQCCQKSKCFEAWQNNTSTQPRQVEHSRNEK